MKRFVLLLAGLAGAAAACGPPAVRPATYADPEILCPGGRSTWGLDILDRRAEREGSQKTVAEIRDGIQRSFPGCAWKTGPVPGSDTIVIEIHRFRSRLEEGSWEAAVEWTVRAQNAGGRTLTEFQANEEVSRPNYRGSDNEKESLSEAYQKALERTVKGLRALPAIGAFRPRPGTPAAPEGNLGAACEVAQMLRAGHLPPLDEDAVRLERKSQPPEES
jgi:hypothetical protein